MTLIKPESIAAFFFAPLGAMCQNGFGTIFGGEPDDEDGVFETTFFGWNIAWRSKQFATS